MAKKQETPPEAAPEGEAQAAPQVELDDSNVETLYANFCRVTGTPEELIIDFGLNSQPYGNPEEALDVKQRLVTNYYTAKRMLHALQMSIARHEQAFGVLETDVRRRVVSQQDTSGQPKS